MEMLSFPKGAILPGGPLKPEGVSEKNPHEIADALWIVHLQRKRTVPGMIPTKE